MNIKKYISLGAVALITVAGLSSCDSKNDPAYIPAGSVSDAQRVFFLKNAYTQIVTAEENSFDVLLYRPDLNILDENGNTTAEMPAQTVAISSSCSETGVLGNMISLPSEVTFAAGSPNATIKVSFDPSKMEGNHYYPVVVTVDPAYANEYSITQTTLSINKEEYTDWAPFVVGEETEVRNGEGSYTFTQYYGGTEDPVRVMARSVPTNEDDIQFQFQWLTDYDDPNSWETFMTAYTKDGGKIVHVDPQPFAYNANYDEDVIVADTYTYTGNDQYKGLTNFDPETGLFTLNLYYYISLGSFGNGNEFLQLRGYKDTNVYELTIQPQGQMEVGGKDYEMVSFDFTDAVTYVDYTVVNGELEEEEVNAVIEKMSDPEQTEYTISTLEAPQNVALTFPSSGDYTVVAVGYNEALDGTVEAKCSAHASFSFKTFDPYAGWKTIREKAVYTDYLVSYLFMQDLTPFELEVQVDASEEFEGLYRITNPYAEFAEDLDIANFGCIQFEMYDEDHINFPMSDTGIIYNGTPVVISSFADYYMQNGHTADEVPAPYWGTFKDGVITLDAFNREDAAPFVIFLGSSAYYLDIDFALDLNANQAAARPRAKTLSNIITRQMMPTSLESLPGKAFYKAEPQGAVSRKLDRASVKSLKIRR